MQQEELLKNEVVRTTKDLKSSVSKYKQWKEQVSYYEETGLGLGTDLLKGASLSFRVGAIDYVEYIQNLSEVETIKMNWFNALLQYNLSLVEIEYLTAKEN